MTREDSPVLNDWKSILVSPNKPISDTIKVVDGSPLGVAVVVDPNNKLLGYVTDTHIRKAILDRRGLEEPVSQIMAVLNNTSGSGCQELVEAGFAALTDSQGAITGIAGLPQDVDSEPGNHKHPVVLMVGGQGVRLRPLTYSCPKPLLEVKGKPLLQRTIERLARQGFQDVFLTVHHHAEMIKDFFEDGSRWGVAIKYLEEKKRLGTAGALSMLADRPEHPLMVMNGDLVTTIQFQNLLNFHRDCKARATMCVAAYDVSIPYGVVTHQGSTMKGILEKPVERHFINAGIYILEPDVLDLVPQDRYFDMPSLFEALMDRGEKVAVCPLREQWIDIGSIETYQQAQHECVEEEEETSKTGRSSDLPVVQSIKAMGTLKPTLMP